MIAVPGEWENDAFYRVNIILFYFDVEVIKSTAARNET